MADSRRSSDNTYSSGIGSELITGNRLGTVEEVL